MNKTIFKYPLQLREEQTILLPEGAEILSIQLQDDIPTLWTMLDRGGKEAVNHRIRMVGTGWAFEAKGRLKFLSTVQTRDGLVFHFFEENAP